MEELIGVMQEILEELRTMKGKLFDIQLTGLYSSIADVCDKLESIESTVESMESTVKNIDSTVSCIAMNQG